MSENKNKPMALTIETGKRYCWCSCGLSKKKAICDGTHKTADTDKRSLSFIAEDNKTVFLCGCTQTKTPPFCDGSHQFL
ncbi:MAG: CDGSH iron-sulfur domain-containing protein [Methylococcales bacterium]|jgi:CDGSH iron-sulfur domain-containing protein 3|nr:CDGSH iron-sulfur domain-containing protein [Methylococcales bacterium]